jgi:CRISPR-associated exonuclease Cas4
MQITATLINYYHLCERKLWLHAHHIRMEHNSDLVLEGKQIGESTYSERAVKNREIELELPNGRGAVKIDFYDAATRTVHEIKKSDKMEPAHIAQVKFYLWALEQCGMGGATGLIEYPRLRIREQVELDDVDRDQIAQWITSIEGIIDSDLCPPLQKLSICKSCAYYDYCFACEE